MNMPVPRDHDDYRTPDLMPTIVQTPPGMYTLQNRVFIIECTYHECLRSSSETQVCVLRAAGKRVGGGEGGVQQIAPSPISHQSPVSVQCLYQKSIPVFLTEIQNIIISDYNLTVFCGFVALSSCRSTWSPRRVCGVTFISMVSAHGSCRATSRCYCPSSLRTMKRIESLQRERRLSG